MDETTEQERLLDYQRARFEEFAVSQGMHGILQGADKNGFYHSNTVNFAHKVWRAAEAPLLERIKELEAAIFNYREAHICSAGGSPIAHNEMMQARVSLLELIPPILAGGEVR